MELSGKSNLNGKVVGIGGAGENIVEYIARKNLSTMGCILINGEIDERTKFSGLPTIILSKEQTTWHERNSVENRRQEAMACKEEIRKALGDCDVVFIVAGMGGGAGTGVSSVVAEIVREIGAMPICLVTTPFAFEGKNRIESAELGVQILRGVADALLVFPNNGLMQADKSLTMAQAFDKGNAVIIEAIQKLLAFLEEHPKFKKEELENFITQMNACENTEVQSSSIDSKIEAKSQPVYSKMCLFHKWDGCLCKKCGKTRRSDLAVHSFQDAKCVRCGEKETIICPDCDGKGTLTTEEYEDNPYISMSGCGGANVTYHTTKCVWCGGTGEISKKERGGDDE